MDVTFIKQDAVANKFYFIKMSGMESKPGENFLSLQCKNRGGTGSEDFRV